MKSVSSARLSRMASGRATWKLRPGVRPSEVMMRRDLNSTSSWLT